MEGEKKLDCKMTIIANRLQSISKDSVIQYCRTSHKNFPAQSCLRTLRTTCLRHSPPINTNKIGHCLSLFVPYWPYASAQTYRNRHPIRTPDVIAREIAPVIIHLYYPAPRTAPLCSLFSLPLQEEQLFFLSESPLSRPRSCPYNPASLCVLDSTSVA